MTALLSHKVVAALPDPLEANSIYYVRVGTGFDLHVTNSSGQIVAYALNQGGGGSAIASGRAEIDFGPNGQDATVIITGQTGITGTSRIFVAAAAVDTADHTARDIVADNGFTIAGLCPFGSHGRYAVDWMWI
jgi:hypothetical protein